MRDFLSKTTKLNRSIVSDDFEETLRVINQRIPLNIFRFPTGTRCFDWILPKKWVIRDAYIKDDTGSKILDWKKHPLHVVVGSLSINRVISRDELLERIYVSDDFFNEIPFRFKYYELDWGFCMTKKQKEAITGGSFTVYIDSEYIDGDLLVGEYTIRGTSKTCVILMAHIDHPAQVNDGLAGAAVLLKLAEALQGTTPQYTLKFQFLPERIGSIAYLHHQYDSIGDILGGIFCEMPGTPEYPLVLQYSKWKDTMLDRIAYYVVKKLDKNAVVADCFKQVVNDDGFYNAPGIDIPCISISRSKPHEIGSMYHFPFYHTSGDNLDNFDFKQAEDYLFVLSEILRILNNDRKVIRKYIGVPHLSRHNLYIDWHIHPELSLHIDDILNSLDNKTSIFDICERHNVDFEEVYGFVKKLEHKGLVKLESTESIWFSQNNPFVALASRPKK